MTGTKPPPVLPASGRQRSMSTFQATATRSGSSAKARRRRRHLPPSCRYTVSALDAAGNVSPPSNTATAQAVAAPNGITVDRIVSVHQGTSSTTISAPGVTTTGSNELFFAFISSDGPNSANSARIAAATGTGLNWTLRQRTNT